jgi:hypothetical protein
MGDFVESTKEASRGGFQGIKKIRGLLVKLEKVDPPESWDSKKQLIEASMEDTAVLEMFPNEEQFDLKDGKFKFSVPYAEEGKTPNKNTIYMKVWVASAEKLGKKPSEFIGQYVTLDKLPILLFSKPKVGEDKKPILDANGKKVMEDVLAVDSTGRPNHFSFVGDETTTSVNVRDYARKRLNGLNQKSALRELILDPQLKQYPEYKEAHNNGTLATMLEMTVDAEGVYHANSAS